MWTKKIHPFLGLKIVPEIIAEMNEKGQTLSTLCKDAEKEEMVCPKPRRLDAGGATAPSQSSAIKPFRRLSVSRTISLPPEREAGCEILDILLTKANSGSLTSHYIGSPPYRAGNPVIYDAHFTQKRVLSSPVNISHKSPAMIQGNALAKSSSRGSKTFERIEGFIPSNGESQQGIPAFA